MNDDFSFADHADRYPPVIARAEVSTYFPWLTAKRLANLDALGEGPSQAMRNGRAVIYPTKPFLAWLDTRMRAQGSDATPKGKEKGGQAGGREDTRPAATRRGRKTKLQEVRERRG